MGGDHPVRAVRDDCPPVVPQPKKRGEAMKHVRHNGKTLLMTLLALGCMASVIMWPQWRDEVRAQTPPEVLLSCIPETFSICNWNTHCVTTVGQPGGQLAEVERCCLYQITADQCSSETTTCVNNQIRFLHASCQPDGPVVPDLSSVGIVALLATVIALGTFRRKSAASRAV
jgi:hypothetical protein